MISFFLMSLIASFTGFVVKYTKQNFLIDILCHSVILSGALSHFFKINIIFSSIIVSGLIVLMVFFSQSDQSKLSAITPIITALGISLYPSKCAAHEVMFGGEFQFSKLEMIFISVFCVAFFVIFLIKKKTIITFMISRKLAANEGLYVFLIELGLICFIVISVSILTKFTGFLFTSSIILVPYIYVFKDSIFKTIFTRFSLIFISLNCFYIFKKYFYNIGNEFILIFLIAIFFIYFGFSKYLKEY